MPDLAYSPEGTIAAIATAPMQSALGILRLSGPGSWQIVRALAPGLPETPEPQHAYVLQLHLTSQNTRLSERAVITLWRAPHSYSGEDMAELSLHGNPLLLELALQACLAAGARLAAPGEFSYRAYLHGKLDLLQAEAVQRLISAGNLAELVQAGAALRGLQSQRMQGWEEELTALLAGIEVIHDYAADDLDASLDPASLLTPERAAEKLRDLAARLSEALDTLSRSAAQRSGISVAICGPPNVGKSTLFNALLGQQRALTSPQPGTTRDYLAEPVQAAGLSFTLVDTAGLRSAEESLEQAGIQLARDWLRSADILLWVSAADWPLAEQPGTVPDADAPPRIEVLTRCDLLPQWPEDNDACCVSGVNGRGLPELWRRLAQTAAQLSPRDGSLGGRESQAIATALDSLRAALAAIHQGFALDAAAVEIYRARSALHQAWQSEDRQGVVNTIFSGFCVGK